MELIKIKKYITGGEVISYHNAIKKVAKSPIPLQPLYEAFMNSWESLSALPEEDSITSQNITIRIFLIPITSPKTFKKSSDEKFEFHKFEIEDTGLGLVEESYKRLQKLYDEGKGLNNRGSGRIQYLHFFKRSFLSSMYEENNEFQSRELLLSKVGKFEQNDALIGEINNEPVKKDNFTRKTLIRFEEPLDEKDLNFYTKLTANYLKDSFVKQFMGLLCLSNKLPNISIEKYEGTQLVEKDIIDKGDFPVKDKELVFSVFYSKLNKAGTSIEETNNKELFTLNTFKIPSDQLGKNTINVTSKGQIIHLEKELFNFPFIKAEDTIYNDRYLFLLSSPYIDSTEGDERGKIELMSKKDFQKRSIFYPESVILTDSIQENINETVLNAYPEIQEKSKEQYEEIKELQELFLLDEETLREVPILINDTAEIILKKVYRKQAENTAKSDAIIKAELDSIKKLNPTADTYYQDLERSADTITTQIPLQNRTALTQFVARRGIVLNLFGKALNRKLDIQDSTRNEDEKILHNILFRQKSENVEISDLWMLNEDFMLYSGCSEFMLKNLRFKGENILKTDEELTEEQIEWRDSLGKKRYDCRIDTILFPSENKCVILEYKNPTALLTDRISQIHNYASLIRNFAKDKYDITLFYGYLIGDRINANELKFHGTGFKPSHNNEYYYCPNRPVEGVWEKENKDGAMYMEIITYESLLARASRRNEIFFNKINVDFDLK